MNLKTTSFCMGAVIAAGITLQPQITAAASLPATPALSINGGQAPPPASGGSSFVVRVAENLDQASAENIQKDLVKEGFTGAESRPARGNTYEVVIGGIGSRQQAEGIVNDLKKSGYTTSVQIMDSGSESASTDSPQSIYRVQVAEFDTADQATEASKILVNEGFVNVDVVEDNGKHILMLGTFNKQEDAKALLGDVNKAGFSLASVVKRERLGGTGSAASVDLSALPADQQAKTRDALAMADKVASGQASADEVKQLRDQIQQLTDNQKAILNRQESNRSTEQNKMLKTYPLNREFDQAIRNKNYDVAEQKLKQIEQINPNDIFLAGKKKVLAEQRSGISSTPGVQAGAPPDPAAVQAALNAARSAEATGNKADALQKYNAVIALDPTNVEARGKVSELTAGSSAPAASAATSTGGLGDDMKKKLMYGGAGLLALIILIIAWMKMRGGKAAPATASPAPATGMSFGASPDLGNSLGGYNAAGTGLSEGTAPAGSTLGGTSALAGAGMAAIPGFHSVEEEEEEAPRPKPVRTPKPAEPESESVSLEDMGHGAPETVTPAPAAQAEEPITFNLEEEPAPGAEPVAPSSAMDADLEALLKGTFPGATGAEASAAEAAPPPAAEPTLVFQQTFDSESEGSSPADWRGEYDYANLSVMQLNEPGHVQCLIYNKLEGVGSATYHLSFPQVTGRVIAEFDIRCDQKNKFLLGVYLEKDEDFKQSVHTIVHQLDPNAPASLRIQGEGAPYQMGEWAHIRYEIDLNAGTIDGYLDGNHVAQALSLATVPEYINTLSIRDNLATIGTLYLDNIRIFQE